MTILNLVGGEDRRGDAGGAAIQVTGAGLDEAARPGDAGDRPGEDLGIGERPAGRADRHGTLVGEGGRRLRQRDRPAGEGRLDLDVARLGDRTDRERVDAGVAGRRVEEPARQLGGVEGGAAGPHDRQGRVDAGGANGARHRGGQGLPKRHRLGNFRAGGRRGEEQLGEGVARDPHDLGLTIRRKPHIALEADGGELRHGGQRDGGGAAARKDEGAAGRGRDLRTQGAHGAGAEGDLQRGVRGQFRGEEGRRIGPEDRRDAGDAVRAVVADDELAALDGEIGRGVVRVGQPDHAGAGLEDGAAGRAGADAGAGDLTGIRPCQHRVVVVEADGGPIVDGEVGRAEAGLAADEGAGMHVDGTDEVGRPEAREVEGAGSQLLDGGAARDTSAVGRDGGGGDIDGQDGARAVDGRTGVARHVGKVLAEARDIQGRVDAEVHGRGRGEGRRGVQLERATREVNRAREGERDVELQETSAGLLEVARALDVALIEGVGAAARHGGRGAEREGVRVDDGGDGAEQHRGAGHGVVVDAHPGLEARRGRGYGGAGDRLGGGAADPGAVSLGADDALIGDGGRG